LGEPEDSGGQTDKEKGGSTGGSDGIWNLGKKIGLRNKKRSPNP